MAWSAKDVAGALATVNNVRRRALNRGQSLPARNEVRPRTGPLWLRWPAELVLSTRTIEAHLRNIYGKPRRAHTRARPPRLAARPRLGALRPR
jgi:hypothetical protein